MSIDNNKRDFEKALESMKETVELLDHCVDDELMKTLTNVIHEYEGHYQSDIEGMISAMELLTSED